MSSLDTLIRISRWRLDERRRHLGELEHLAEKLRREAQRLAAELSDEQRVAALSPEAGSAYFGYARGVIARREKLAASLAEVDEQILAAREALAEGFREAKRHEAAAANRAKRERVAGDRRQRLALDELAIELYRRRGQAAS